MNPVVPSSRPIAAGLPRLFAAACIALSAACTALADSFYVDPAKGSDFGPGTIGRPFLSLERALEHVRARVRAGHKSDHVYLRGGVYRMTSTATQYWLTLVGTPDAPAVLSAMPAEAGAPGAVERKSGRWYEKVVFDDGWEIRGPWTRTPGRDGVWETKPGFALNEWPADKLKWALPTAELAEQAPKVHLFSLAPYMILQDGRPTFWARDLDGLTEPGRRCYDFRTGTLYVRPFGDADPNKVRFESWYGGPDKPGHLLRDGEGRALFDGNLEHAEIRGFEFRLLTRTFEFHRRGYTDESERVKQRHVLLEDNEWRYCYIHLLQDANTVFQRGDDEFLPPAFDDRSHWTVRNNLFFRPAKECFQVHGSGHVFEHNEIIEHGGPWAGPAARVGAVNARNMPGAVIRHNFIWGHDINPWDIGSVFMIEAQGRSHADENGDNIFGGQVYEHNVFAGINAGPALVIGKGGVRMRDITIRYNLFAGNRAGEGIQIASPHENLHIHDNIFTDQARPIAVMKAGALLQPELKSMVTIERNIFSRSAGAGEDEIFNAVAGSGIVVRDNVAHGITVLAPEMAARHRIADPGFVSPQTFDFRLSPDSALRALDRIPGPYTADGSLLTGETWRKLRSKYGDEPFKD